MKFYIKTYGCQMNERDSDAVAALLVQRGHELASGEGDAELLLINTCSVRAKAEHKALGKLGLTTAPNRSKTLRLVGAFGCMVERLGPRLFDKLPNLDFAVGTHRFRALPDIVDRVLAGPEKILAVGENPDGEHAVSEHAVLGVSAFVNILFGCNRGCSYCIVPTVRGGEISRPAREILDELRDLAARQVREVTLLGQSVMAYGRAQAVWEAADRSPGGYQEPFARLLEAAAEIEGLRRIRFASGHPSGCTAELARVMGAVPKLCRHLHLPLQSASDRILKMMRRGYSADDYRRAVARLRETVPDIAITTDIIVGFPSESPSEFEATRAFMDEIGFDNAFIFKYSPRPGTPAAGWPDDIAMDEKIRRNKTLLQDQNRRTLAVNEAMIGRTADVLVEGVSPRNPDRWTGRTSGNKIVVFSPEFDMRKGDMIRVRIARAMPQTLYGAVEGSPCEVER